MKKDVAKRSRHGLSLYFHEASRDRLSALAQLLNITKAAVVAQAVSRWVLQVSKNPQAQWAWHLEQPFRENGHCRRKKIPGAPKMYVNVSESVVRQVESLSDVLHIPLSSVVEQALLRWCREDPLVHVPRQSEESRNVAAQAGGA